MHTQVAFQGANETGTQPHGNAVFDGPGDIYRYWLTRSWDIHKPNVAFIMLNPSTADAFKLDPTVRRCIGFAKRWGMGSLTVVNLFAFRTPSVLRLKSFVGDITGPENNKWILQAAVGARLIVCAWGAHGTHIGRGRYVTDYLLQMAAFNLHRLGPALDGGQPRHPLYVPYTMELEIHK